MCSPKHAADGGVGAGGDGLQHALEDEVLGVGDDGCLLGVGLPVDPEELLLEGATVVEREDVELAVRSGGHGSQSIQRAWGGVERSLEWGDDDLGS
jgi:hypothetical protein